MQSEKQRVRLQTILNSFEQTSKELTLSEDYLPISSRKGSLSWPVRGRVAKQFGNIRSGSLRWEGWLINTVAGTPVNAVHQGRVVFSNYLRGFGLLIILDHGESFLMHCLESCRYRNHAPGLSMDQIPGPGVYLQEQKQTKTQQHNAMTSKREAKKLHQQGRSKAKQH